MNKKIKFVLNPNLQFEIDSSYFSKQNISTLLMRVITWLGSAFVVIQLVNLFRIFILKNQVDSELMYLQSAITTALVCLYILLLVLKRQYAVVDPPVFIGVLLFGLLTMTAWIFSPLFGSYAVTDTVRQINTFGQAGMKHIAGITVINMIGLFYFSSSFIRSRRVLNWMIIGIICLVFVGLIPVFGQIDVISLPTLATMSGLSFIFSLSLLNKLPDYRLSAVVLAVVSLASTFALPAEIGWISLFVILISILVMIWMHIITGDFDLNLPLAEWVKTLRKREFGSAMQERFLLLNQLVVVVIVSLLIIMWILIFQPPVNEYVVTYASDLGRIFSGVRVGELILGGQTIPVSLSQNFTNLHHILAYQGLVGLIAYVVLFISGMVLIYRYITTKQNNLIRVILPLLVFIPVLGLFSNLNIFLITLWWLVLSIVSLSEYLPRLLLSDKETKQETHLNKWLTGLIVVLIPIIIIMFMGINNQLLTLFSEGVI